MTNLNPTDIAELERVRLEKADSKKRSAFQEAEDFKWVMSDKRGRRVMRALLDKAGVYRISFTGKAEDTIFREGERNIGLMLLARMMKHCPERYAQMLKEQNDD